MDTSGQVETMVSLHRQRVGPAPGVGIKTIDDDAPLTALPGDGSDHALHRNAVEDIDHEMDDAFDEEPELTRSQTMQTALTSHTTNTSHTAQTGGASTRASTKDTASISDSDGEDSSDSDDDDGDEMSHDGSSVDGDSLANSISLTDLHPLNSSSEYNAKTMSPGNSDVGAVSGALAGVAGLGALGVGGMIGMGQHMPKPPRHFLCPIQNTLLVDPVIDREGHTYERDAILRWLVLTSQNFDPVGLDGDGAGGNAGSEEVGGSSGSKFMTGTSPITGNPMSVEELVEDRVVRSAIERWRKECWVRFLLGNKGGNNGSIPGNNNGDDKVQFAMEKSERSGGGEVGVDVDVEDVVVQPEEKSRKKGKDKAAMASSHVSHKSHSSHKSSKSEKSHKSSKSEKSGSSHKDLGEKRAGKGDGGKGSPLSPNSGGSKHKELKDINIDKPLARSSNKKDKQRKGRDKMKEQALSISLPQEPSISAYAASDPRIISPSPETKPMAKSHSPYQKGKDKRQQLQVAALAKHHPPPPPPRATSAGGGGSTPPPPSVAKRRGNAHATSGGSSSTSKGGNGGRGLTASQRTAVTSNTTPTSAATKPPPPPTAGVAVDDYAGGIPPPPLESAPRKSPAPSHASLTPSRASASPATSGSRARAREAAKEAGASISSPGDAVPESPEVPVKSIIPNMSSGSSFCSNLSNPYDLFSVPGYANATNNAVTPRIKPVHNGWSVPLGVHKVVSSAPGLRVTTQLHRRSAPVRITRVDRDTLGNRQITKRDLVVPPGSYVEILETQVHGERVRGRICWEEEIDDLDSKKKKKKKKTLKKRTSRLLKRTGRKGRRGKSEDEEEKVIVKHEGWISVQWAKDNEEGEGDENGNNNAGGGGGDEFEGDSSARGMRGRERVTDEDAGPWTEPVPLGVYRINFGGGLPLRETPERDSTVIGKLDRGRCVEVVQTQVRGDRVRARVIVPDLHRDEDGGPGNGMTKFTSGWISLLNALTGSSGASPVPLGAYVVVAEPGCVITEGGRLDSKVRGNLVPGSCIEVVATRMEEGVVRGLIDGGGHVTLFVPPGGGGGRGANAGGSGAGKKADGGRMFAMPVPLGTYQVIHNGLSVTSGISSSSPIVMKLQSNSTAEIVETRVENGRVRGRACAVANEDGSRVVGYERAGSAAASASGMSGSDALGGGASSGWINLFEPNQRWAKIVCFRGGRPVGQPMPSSSASQQQQQQQQKQGGQQQQQTQGFRRKNSTSAAAI